MSRFGRNPRSQCTYPIDFSFSNHLALLEGGIRLNCALWIEMYFTGIFLIRHSQIQLLIQNKGSCFGFMTTLGDRYSTFPNLCFVGSRTGKKCALKVIRDCPESRREVGFAYHQNRVKVSGVCTIVFLFRWSFSGRPAAARRYSLKSWLSNPPPPLRCQIFQIFPSTLCPL